jgi:hypothetical protein
MPEDYSNLHIKSKKISELNDYDKNIVTDGDETYIVVAYTKNGAKENYKLSLKQLSDIIGLDQLNFRFKEILENVEGSINNATGIKRREPVILHYHPFPGFKMPETISVIGASYTYDYINSSLLIESPDIDNESGIITISITGVAIEYPVIIELEHITPTIIERQLMHNPIMTVGDTLVLKLTPDDGYVIPDEFEYENCELEFDRVNQLLYIRCTVAACENNINNDPIIIRGAASNKKYYFAHFAYGVDDNYVTYRPITINGSITQVPSNIVIDESNLPANIYSSRGFPIPNTINELFNHDERYTYGYEEVWLLLPKTYLYHANGEICIIDDNGQKYNIYTGNQTYWAITIDESYLFDITINDVQYVVFPIAYEGLYTNMLTIKKQ